MIEDPDKRRLMPFRLQPVYARPFNAVAVEGEVVVMAHRASEALTPEAALESAERMRRAAEEALAQRASPEAPDDAW